MEIKDITVSVEKMEEVRGGNSITQTSTNGYVAGAVAVGGWASNGSPNYVTSSVSQANLTSQQALIEDHDITTVDVDILGSQIFAGFPFV